MILDADGSIVDIRQDKSLYSPLHKMAILSQNMDPCRELRPERQVDLDDLARATLLLRGSDAVRTSVVRNSPINEMQLL